MGAISRRLLRYWQIWVLVSFGSLFARRWLHHPASPTAACAVLLAVGCLLNVLVIAANGGFMPAARKEDELPHRREAGTSRSTTDLASSC